MLSSLKKIGLSGMVILAFIFYAIHQSQEASSAASSVLAPIQSTTSTTDSSSPGNAGNTTGSTGNTSGGTGNTNSSMMNGNTGSGMGMMSGKYRDGQYTGPVTDAFYGNVEVRVTISGGKISDVLFLQYPNDRRTSIEINSQAMPFLKQEAIAAQSANVDTISGASATSGAFRESLQGALNKAI